MCIVMVLVAAILPAHATINIVTSLPDLADFVRIVGGERVEVQSIVRGDQNPHYIEVKPSYMMKLRNARLFFIVGMDLEKWAQQIVDGSRNASLEVVDLSRRITKLEVPTRLDASEGDVHRFGNPHYWLDPRNVPIILDEVVAMLSKASPADAAAFKSNADAYVKRLEARTREWEEQMRLLKGRQILTFHRSWTYFAAWLNLTVAGQVEPKPGVPPSPSHTAAMIDLARKNGIKAIIVEPFYDTSAADQIAAATGAKVIRLSTSAGGVKDTGDYMATMDYNVSTLADALK
jgi:ABC-type Zn uptake system ZnuABC Zn-binding protein ZnuA